MSAEANRALLRRYVAQVWDGADPEAVARFTVAEYRRYTSPTSPPLDVAAQIERLKAFRRSFPDIRVEVQDVVATDEYIVFRSTLQGTHRGEFLGLPPTGRRVTVGLLDLIRVENGLFAEHWGGPDMLDLARQLGARVTVDQ